MSETSDDEVIGGKFSVFSIEKTEPPEGVEKGDWYAYVIVRGDSEIRGKRTGTRKAVSAYVEEYVDNLNRRATLGYSAYATRKSTK